MNKPARDFAYRARMLGVLKYIDTHLDTDLSLDQLSNVAAFSRFHFHRQFSQHFGINVYQYVQQLRLKRASFELAFRTHRQVIDVALANGYDSPESFARAFKKSLGQSPTQFRAQPQWTTWHGHFQTLHAMRKLHMNTPLHAAQVSIVQFQETRVAVLEHRGAPELLGNTIRRFIEWRKLNKLPPAISATFNLVYDDPDDTPADEYRFDLCAATDMEIAPNTHGIVSKCIPAGRCAKIRHVGPDAGIGDCVRYLYQHWLPDSAEELRDFPLFFQRVTLYPDVPEQAMVTDIYLPLK